MHKSFSPLNRGLGAGFILLFLGIFSGSGFFVFIGIAVLFFVLREHHPAFKMWSGSLFASFRKAGQAFNSSHSAHDNNKFNVTASMNIINPDKKRRIKWGILFSFFIFFGIIFASSFWVVVEAGETGVQSFFGKVRDKEFRSGFHLKNPLVKVTKMIIRTQEYTMSVAQGEGRRVGSDAISALTKEGLSVDLDITVLYHLIEDKASDLYREVGLDYDEIIIRPQIRSMIREIIAQYEAKDIYSEKREEAATQILDGLKRRLEQRGIEMEEVLLRHVQLPANLAESIQQKLQAEQEAERYDFLLDRELKEAERKRVEAQGQRDAQKIINESLTQNYLHYLYIQNLKDREGTVYVPVSPDNGLPLFRGL